MSQPDKELDIASDRAHSFRDRFDGRQFATTYKDIPIFAAPGVHELALERLSEALPPGDGVEVLELGAGGGAMSLRLADAGYRVTSSDLFEGSFTPAGKIPFLTLDLNQSFADRLPRQFDAVVALELIEHLENPNHFFRQCRRLLKPGSHLLVSTPNLVNPVSQAMFLRQGVFQWFRDEDYRDQGHIMPLAPAVLRRCWTEGGFDCRWEGSVSDPMRMLHRRLDRRSRWLAKLLAREAAGGLFGYAGSVARGGLSRRPEGQQAGLAVQPRGAVVRRHKSGPAATRQHAYSERLLGPRLLESRL